MTPRDRTESRIALAMLPVGATMTFVSVVAFVTIMILLVATLVQRPGAAMLMLGWCAAALGIAVFNTLKSIETMSAFDWRPMVPVGALSALITATYPGWWM
jgi:hypothetical protein